MTQAGTALAPTIEKLTVAPLCSLEEAKARFEGKYLDSSHVKLRLSESAQIVTPDGETKFLFLKGVLPVGTVARSWRTLRKLRFSPAKHSRRKALKTSAGGEVLFGWILFPSQEKGGGMMPTPHGGHSRPVAGVPQPVAVALAYSTPVQPAPS